jgi:hypothetical protein
VLRLVLNSTDLAPEDKVDLARRITEAVAYLESGNADRRSARYVLRDIEIGAYRGEDIAGRVREIIRNIENK